MGAYDWRGKTHLDTMAAGAEGAGVAREVRREGERGRFEICLVG